MDRFFFGVFGLASVMAGSLLNPVCVGQEVTTKAHMVVDFQSGRILAAKNSREPRQIASLTKVAAALVALEWLDKAGPNAKDNLTTVHENRIAGGSNPLKLRAGDKISLETTIFAAVMASDNASAEVLAEYVGRQISGKKAWQGVDFFVGKMNKLAMRLGMSQTKFVNPHGLEKPNKRGISSAQDMAVLAMAALGNPSFLRYCSSRERTLSYLRNGEKKSVTIQHTNELMGTRGIDGIKTGTTKLAGACLMSTAAREFPGDPSGKKHRLISVVLGSDDRFHDTVLLLDEGWENYVQWLRSGKPIPADRQGMISIGGR